MKRILFVAEAVTLAQVVRLVTLARALPSDQYEVHFASARFDPVVFAQTNFVQHPLQSISPEQVERAIAWGTRIYSGRVLRRYVDADLALIDRVQPELIVGDLRWSLLVSAPLRRVPHAALINAYWSPWAERERFPLPDHPIVRLLGERLAAEHFPRALPFVFRHFARPLDALRKQHRLAPLGGLLELLVAGDHTLYADAPELIPMRPELPASHHFLGPVLWAPEVALPPWWNELGGRPSVYVTLGSSGNLRALPKIVAALAELPVDVMVATAGRVRLENTPRNVFVADYLPGDLAARRASVVICNGGSSTGYQALAEGRAVIGLPWNLDQYLAMTCIQSLGAGALLRASTVEADGVQSSVASALEGAFEAGTQLAQRALRSHDSAERFRTLVAQFASPGAGSSRSSR